MDKFATQSSIFKNCDEFRLRTFRGESTIIYPLDSYQTWMDAGHLEPLVPDVPDPKYNANVWRHFCSKESTPHPITKKRSVSALVASMYPLCIPPPSRMGEFSYARYIQYGDIYRDPIMKKKQITWSENEIQVSL